jgi:hypothetical protein
MWFGVLHSVTELVHAISALDATDPLGASALDALRDLVKDTLQALLGTSSSVSFARLFKRLVEVAPKDAGANSAVQVNEVYGDSTKNSKKAKNKKKHKKQASSTASTPSQSQPTGRAYAEFRTILTGMLDSFRADADLLALSIRLIEADGFDLLQDKVALAARGWRPSGGCACGSTGVRGVRADGAVFCEACGEGLVRDGTEDAGEVQAEDAGAKGELVLA